MVTPASNASGGPTEAASERVAALIGRTLSDRYRIIELVAMGGMGAIYRAEHVLMRKQVAVKVLHPEVEGFPELVARFEREAVAGAHVDHPNVATANDFGKFDGESRFLVLELIKGSTFRELIDRGPLAPRRAAWMIRQAAAGLAAVHHKGIVHRDIKPRNLMVVDETRRTRRGSRKEPGEEDVVKLIDFGLAKVPVEELSTFAQDADNPRRSLTAAGVVMGTIGYLAPEAALGTRAILPPADLYALGVVFYEMLCGKRLFERGNAAEVFAAHRNEPVPRLSEANPGVDVPLEIEAVVRRLLEKDPSDRYPSAKALMDALDGVLAASPPPLDPLVEARRPASAHPPRTLAPAAHKNRRRALWAAGAVVAAMAVFVLAAGLGGSADEARSNALEASAGALEASAGALEAASGAPPSAVDPPPRAPAGALDRLRAASDTRDYPRAMGTLLELADQSPDAFADRAVQTEAASLIEAAAADGVDTEPIFARLTDALGTHGLDVLYDLVTRELAAPAPLARPTGAGSKARALLAKPEVVQRATAAMQVAYDLRRSSCQHRQDLFPRAAEEGDDRALEILRSMQPPACSMKDACCFLKHRQLERTIADIEARIRH